MLSRVFLILGVLDAIASGINTIIGFFTGAVGIILEFIQGVVGTLLYFVIFLPLSFIVVFLHEILLNLVTIAPVPRNENGEITIFGTPAGGADDPLGEMLRITGSTIADGYMEPIALLIVLIGIGLVLFFRIFDVVIDDIDFNSDAQKKLILAPILIFLWLPLANIVLALAYSLTQVFLGIELEAGALANSVEGGADYFDGQNNSLNFQNLIQSIGPEIDSLGDISDSSLIAVVIGIYFIFVSIPVYVVGAVLAMLRLFLLYLLYAIGPLAIAMWAFSWRDISELGKGYIRYFILLALFPIPAALINTLLPLFILLIEAVLTQGGGASTVDFNPSTSNLNVAGAFGIGKAVRSLAIILTPLVITFGPWAFVVGLGKAMAAAGVTAAASGAIATGGASLAASSASSSLGGAVKSAGRTVEEEGVTGLTKRGVQGAKDRARSVGQSISDSKDRFSSAVREDGLSGAGYSYGARKAKGGLDRTAETIGSGVVRGVEGGVERTRRTFGMGDNKSIVQRMGGRTAGGVEKASDYKRGIMENKEQLLNVMSNSSALRRLPGGGAVQGMARYTQKGEELRNQRDAVLAEMSAQRAKGEEMRKTGGLVSEHVDSDIAEMYSEELDDGTEGLIQAEKRAVADSRASEGMLKRYMTRHENMNPEVLERMNPGQKAALFDNMVNDAKKNGKGNNVGEKIGDFLGDEKFEEEFGKAIDVEVEDVIGMADSPGQIIPEIDETYDGGGNIMKSTYADSVNPSEGQIRTAEQFANDYDEDIAGVSPTRLVATLDDMSSTEGIDELADRLGIEDSDKLVSELNSSALVSDEIDSENDNDRDDIVGSLNVNSDDISDIAQVERGESVTPENGIPEQIGREIAEDDNVVVEQSVDRVEAEKVSTSAEDAASSGGEMIVSREDVAADARSIGVGIDDEMSDMVSENVEKMLNSLDEGAKRGIKNAGKSLDNFEAEAEDKAKQRARDNLESFEEEILNAMEQADSVKIEDRDGMKKLQQTSKQVVESAHDSVISSMKNVDKEQLRRAGNDISQLSPEARTAVRDAQDALQDAVESSINEIQNSLSEAQREAIEQHTGGQSMAEMDTMEVLGTLKEVDESSEADMSRQIQMIEDRMN